MSTTPNLDILSAVRIVSQTQAVELIWRKQWTTAKGMYFASRYIPWMFELALLTINIDGTTGLFFTMSQCRKWMIVQAVTLQLIVTIVDVILMTRVYALFNRNRTLLWVLIVLFCGEISYMSYVLSYVTPKLTYNDDCFVTSSPPIFVSYWIVSLVFETFLFLLTLVKFFEALRRGWGHRPIMRQFISDGTWAYALIFATMSLNSMLYKFVHSPLAGICFTWLLSVLSIAGSRLVLNPRRRSQEESSKLEDLSPISPTTRLAFKDTQLDSSLSTNGF
ncbi:unnamed protein product [Somion occarium]|uniref:Transmembrane protein n=1 Tax=Somion occarium TaxID=3059160 RepID=A0ABP1CP44_9APHY